MKISAVYKPKSYYFAQDKDQSSEMPFDLPVCQALGGISQYLKSHSISPSFSSSFFSSTSLSLLRIFFYYVLCMRKVT